MSLVSARGLLLVGLLAAGASAQEAEPEAARPRLVVLVSVDQMIPEHLDRLAPWLEGGLGRFHREGRTYRAAALEYSGTETGPGHATYSTGCLPRRHGIVANDFLVRSEDGWSYCCHGADVATVTSAGGEAPGQYPSSPARLLVPALGDRLRARFPGAHVVAIAGKDRAAVLMGGQQPDLALWWHSRAGGFASSSWYADALPEWVDAWNAGWLEQARGFVWERSFEGALEGSATAADDRPGEVRRKREGPVFPYPAPAVSEEPSERELRGLASWIYVSPLSDRFVAQLAARAVDAVELGADDEPDLLALSFSACDTVGHQNGPYSVEVTDVLLRLDRELGALFDLLDERVGPGRWVAALSSDHGVLELPERLQEEGIGARRLSWRDLRGRLLDAATAAVEAELGVTPELRASADGIYVAAKDALAEPEALARARAAVRAALLAKVPEVEGAWTFEQLAAETPDELDPWGRSYWASFHPDRAADVSFLLPPWTLIMGSGTTHGTPYPYDRRTPLVFLGPGFAPGTTSYERASSMDALPTLLDRLGIEPPEGIDGRVLR